MSGKYNELVEHRSVTPEKLQHVAMKIALGLLPKEACALIGIDYYKYQAFLKNNAGTEQVQNHNEIINMYNAMYTEKLIKGLLESVDTQASDIEIRQTTDPDGNITIQQITKRRAPRVSEIVDVLGILNPRFSNQKGKNGNSKNQGNTFNIISATPEMLLEAQRLSQSNADSDVIDGEIETDE